MRLVQHAARSLLAMSYSWWQQWVPAGWWEPTGWHWSWQAEHGGCGGVSPYRSAASSSHSWQPISPLAAKGKEKGQAVAERPWPPTQAQALKKQKQAKYPRWHPRRGDTDSRAHILAIPWPYRVVDMPPNWMATWKAKAQEEALTVSIRAPRSAAWRDNPELVACCNILSIRGPPADLGSRWRAMQLYTDMVLDLQDQGIECPSLGPDEIFEIRDDDDGNDGAQVIEITHEGVTSTIDREGPRDVRATLTRVPPKSAPVEGTPELVVLLRRFHSRRKRPQASPEEQKQAPAQPGASSSSSGPPASGPPATFLRQPTPEAPLDPEALALPGQDTPDWGQEEVAAMQELYNAAQESLHRNASLMHHHAADLVCRS